MNLRKLPLLLGIALAAVNVSRAGLLDDVIREPGRWNQMCSAPRPVPFDVPLPLYALATPRNFELSDQNLAGLKQQRATVVADIAAHLDRMDLSKAKPRDESKSFNFKGSHQDPEQPTGALLDIILELDAVEALPGLLKVEADLNQRMEAAVKDGGASLPALDLDAPMSWEGADYKSESYAKQKIEFAARVYQREMLSVMAALLRHERFKPLLDSKLEAAFFEHLKKDSESRELAGIKKPVDVATDRARWIGFDTVHGLPFHKHPVNAATTPYSPELRLEIRQFAADYLKQAKAGSQVTQTGTK